MVWKPGETGNAGGKPAGKEKLLRERLLPHVDAAVAALLAALKDPARSVPAAREILDRVYGKAPQALELAGAGGGPITIEIKLKQPEIPQIENHVGIVAKTISCTDITSD